MRLKPSLAAVAFAAAAAASSSLGSAAKAETPQAVGIATLTVPAPERGGSIEVMLWYPAAGKGKPERIGDNAIFQGVGAQRDAPLDAPSGAGSMPLILLAHGGLRAAPNTSAWIAVALAERGFLVAVPRQPDPRSLAAHDAPREIWLRPADLSATLTALENDSIWAGHIDTKRIGALGFLLGGTSALALAGARLDAAIYAHECDHPETAKADPDCAWFAKAGVDLHAVDAAKLSRANRDPRIRAVVAIDPEQAAAFTPKSLAEIAIPVELVNLGAVDTLPPRLDASHLAPAIPAAIYQRVPEATQFSAFNHCKPEAAAILRDAADAEPLCDDPAGHTRADIHAQLATRIERAFRKQFGN
jgi:predicted dienelactone hydrolase